MTRRERKEQRLENRLTWAASRDAKAAAKFEGVRRIADNIPLGQPILVGHHSEKHARKDQERMHNGMAAGVASQKMAEHHRSVADGIERQLDRSIFSDDTDAVEALEARIGEREAKRARMVLVNKLYRKGDAAGLAAIGSDLEALRAACAKAGGYFGKQPHMPYEMTNLGGLITADKKRLQAIKAQAERAEQAAAAGGLLVQYHKGQRFEIIPCPDCATAGSGGCLCGGSGKRGHHTEDARYYVSLTFEDKPARAILDALRAAGFHWGAGRWTGETSKLPAEVVIP